MMIIKKDAYANGGRPPMQSFNSTIPPKGYAAVPETMDTTVFYDHNGFVLIETEEINGIETVKSMEPNIEAWEAWKATIPADPDPEPDPEPVPEPGKTGDEATYDEMAAAIREGVNEV